MSNGLVRLRLLLGREMLVPVISPQKFESPKFESSANESSVFESPAPVWPTLDISDSEDLGFRSHPPNRREESAWSSPQRTSSKSAPVSRHGSPIKHNLPGMRWMDWDESPLKPAPIDRPIEMMKQFYSSCHGSVSPTRNPDRPSFQAAVLSTSYISGQRETTTGERQPFVINKIPKNYHRSPVVVRKSSTVVGQSPVSSSAVLSTYKGNRSQQSPNDWGSTPPSSFSPEFKIESQSCLNKSPRSMFDDDDSKSALFLIKSAQYTPKSHSLGSSASSSSRSPSPSSVVSVISVKSAHDVSSTRFDSPDAAVNSVRLSCGVCKSDVSPSHLCACLQCDEQYLCLECAVRNHKDCKSSCIRVLLAVRQFSEKFRQWYQCRGLEQWKNLGTQMAALAMKLHEMNRLMNEVGKIDPLMKKTIETSHLKPLAESLKRFYEPLLLYTKVSTAYAAANKLLTEPWEQRRYDLVREFLTDENDLTKLCEITREVTKTETVAFIDQLTAKHSTLRKFIDVWMMRRMPPAIPERNSRQSRFASSTDDSRGQRQNVPMVRSKSCSARHRS